MPPFSREVNKTSFYEPSFTQTRANVCTMTAACRIAASVAGVRAMPPRRSVVRTVGIPRSVGGARTCALKGQSTRRALFQVVLAASSDATPDPPSDQAAESPAVAEVIEEKPPKVPPFVPPPIAAPVLVGDKLRARDIIKETIRMSSRDLLPSVALICVAGAAAQVLNLGGTFFLALIQLHDVEVVAALFLMTVQFWKLCCEIMARIAVMRNARDVDAGDATKFQRVKLAEAWGAITGGYEGWRDVLFIDGRRMLSIAWNSVLTIPVPYLGVVKVLDYALCVPVYLFEGKLGKENLKRSEELMLGYRLTLLRAAFGLGGILAAAFGLSVGAFMVICPTLPQLLMPAEPEPGSAAATASQRIEGAVGSAGDVAAGSTAEAAVDAAVVGAADIGEAAKGLFDGTSFDRVWEVGSMTEKMSTIALLSCAVIGSFVFTIVLRHLLYVMHREVSARWKPPAPPDPVEAGKKGGLLSKLMFWKKKSGDESAEDAGTEEDKGGEQVAPKPAPA